MIAWIALGVLYLFGMLSTINTVHACGNDVFQEGRWKWIAGFAITIFWPIAAVIAWFVRRGN